MNLSFSLSLRQLLDDIAAAGVLEILSVNGGLLCNVYLVVYVAISTNPILELRYTYFLRSASCTYSHCLPVRRQVPHSGSWPSHFERD
jgi:hypothetical protein